MHLSEKMDWDFFCYCIAFCFFLFFFLPLLNLCQFNTKHFQLGIKRSVEIYWLPKWIVNSIGCWERAVLLLPLAILHYIKMALPLNGILRCQCFLQALIFLFFFTVLPSLFTQMHFAWLLTGFTVSWGSGLADRSRLSPHPEPSQEPWGHCKEKPRLVGFDSCRSLLAWPGCYKDLYCFLISREYEVIELFPEIWEAESAVKSFNTARNLLFSVGFTIRSILPLRMFLLMRSNLHQSFWGTRSKYAGLGCPPQLNNVPSDAASNL